MQGNIVKHRGSPAPTAAKQVSGESAKDTSIVYVEKANRIPGDLLARTIACQPPNEARIRGLAA